MLKRQEIDLDIITSFWTTLEKPKKLMIAAASLVAFFGILFVTQTNSAGPMGLLYSGLGERASGEVITALETRGVPYEVRGSAIFVPEAQRDRLRMSLAGDGLPTIGEKGYELLDNLSGFGTTSQMFNAAYWRAKEGELARTILEAPHIKSARVHISVAPDRPFRRGVRPSAAVTVESAAGNLSPEQARALRYLIAAAVSGMAPQDVSVIDEVGGLILSGDDVGAHGGEDPRSSALKAKVENLLAARVGHNNAVVEVSIETTKHSEIITERRLDPETRVVISEEAQELTGSSENGLGGQVTVASNLPEGDNTAASGGRTAQNAETRQRTNYDVSETQREISRGPGDIRRISVAVLINHEAVPQQDGTVTMQARTPEELDKLSSLVASAVGFDEARGDLITIESMLFEPSSELGSYAGPGASIFDNLNPVAMLQYIVGAIVVLILGLFVVKPILLAGKISAADQTADVLTPPEGIAAMEDQGEALAAADENDASLPDIAMAPPLDFGGFETATDFGGLSVDADDPAEKLRSLIAERQDETLQVLQSWLAENNTATGGIA